MSGWVPKPASGRPAEPFEANNERALRHGAFSPRKRNPIAREYVEGVLSTGRVSYLADDPSFLPALWAWAEDEAEVELLAEDVAEFGRFDADGNERAPYRALERAKNRAAKARARLGLDPVSRAALQRDLADSRGPDLAALFRNAALPIAETEEEPDA